MATDRADVLVLFYRVTCTEETDDWAPDAFPCMLVLPDEPDPRSELPLRRWSEIRTEPGRWYRFRSLKRHQWVPLTAEQAEWFRGTGWLVEAPRLPKSTAEWEAANHRRTRIAERAEAPRRREAALEVCRQSLRAAAEEAVENLWLPRLYRKISRQLCPDSWLQVRVRYLHQWCETTGTWKRLPGRKKVGGGVEEVPLEEALELEWIRDPRREGPENYIPDLDFIRCIVFGWADGSDPEALDHWVRRWREELHPAIEALEPVTRSWLPGPELLTYVTQTLPAIRPQLDQIIDGWPDSPPALQGLLRDFGPAVERLRPVRDLVRQLQELSAPDPAKDEFEDQGRGIAYPLEVITLGDEIAALERLAASQAKLAALLSDVGRCLEKDWEIAEDGTLKQLRHGKPGREFFCLTRTILGLYDYLRPIYLRTFGDHRPNPEPLRCHISLLLSPYFHRSEIGPEPGAPIWKAIKNHRA